MSVVFYTDNDLKYLYKKYDTEVVKLDIDYVEYNKILGTILFYIKTNPKQVHRFTYIVDSPSIFETMIDYNRNHRKMLIYMPLKNE